ncbi:MAG: uroporphyrinogen decarboxylase, partial [Thermoleophilia bacterium]|nr:uroporphyrinogen decarboxylase [Thermoleophilia bacterium]
ELSCQVTLQPVDAFNLDAAIIFSDILVLLEGLGFEVRFAAGEGPVISNPVRDAADVRSLRVADPEETMWFTLEAIKLVRQELKSRGLPLIGFSGAPFTLACYAVEGQSSRDFRGTKRLMMERPDLWHALMAKLAQLVGDYLVAQVRAGAQALQLFDTWAGVLAPADYSEFVLPYSRQVIETASGTGVPVIHFSLGTNGMLELIRQAGGGVIGVDWRVDLAAAWARLGPDVALQGNLDPAALLAPWPELKRRAAQVLDAASGRPGHIFNLGHGVLPETPPDNVRRLVDFVHEYGIKDPEGEAAG